jgi:hypothetical protein
MQFLFLCGSWSLFKEFTDFGVTVFHWSTTRIEIACQVLGYSG